MHLPTRPVWSWLILSIPFLVLLALWATEQKRRVQLKPLIPWLVVATCLLLPTYFLTDPTMGIGRHKVLHMASFAGLYACWFVTLWIRGRCAFATLSAPDAKWYLPWSPAKFSVPAPGVRVLVRDIDWVLPWYVEKLGLRKLAENPHGESGVATLRFKVDGNSVVLATRSSMAPPKTPMLFTKKISKIRNVLVARGVEVGSVERDRQGTRYFDIHDPEGNLIEFVEEA